MKHFIRIKKNIPNNFKQLIRRFFRPRLLYCVSKSTKPISEYSGFDRGTPIDRYYIEQFLRSNKSYVRGVCLEVLNNDYTLKYGGTLIHRSDVLDIDSNNKVATIVDDLRSLRSILDNTYDCIILTQVLQFIDDLDAAISACYRVLKPKGTLLITLPAISRVDKVSGLDHDYWRFTKASATYLFEKKFEKHKLEITYYGNVRAGMYFYAGLSQEETDAYTLDDCDPNFPTIISIRATK